VARVQLAHYLGIPLGELPVSITEFTTTDIAAACSVAGVKVVSGTKRTVRRQEGAEGCSGRAGEQTARHTEQRRGGLVGLWPHCLCWLTRRLLTRSHRVVCHVARRPWSAWW
jgi:hypothetical protein